MTVVKICGIKTISAARVAIAAGADYLGFNFYPPSPRYINPFDCTQITRAIKPEYPEIRLVGVFVNETINNIQDVLQDCELDLAQLHGDETPELVAQLAPRAYKALRGLDDEIERYIQNGAPACLVDAAVKDAYGGTGHTANWSKAAVLARRHPIFLAGGLNPKNVAEAIHLVRPWGVDVASGVESAPGVKDDGKMRAFVRNVRSTDASFSHRERIPARLENR